MKKSIITLVFIGIVVLFLSFFMGSTSGDDFGHVTIRVIDQNGLVVIEDELRFEEEQSLYDLLQKEYDIACLGAGNVVDETCSSVIRNVISSSHVILSINDVETDFYSNYLHILIDDVPSNIGVDGILLEDGVTYTFEYVDLGGE